MRYKVHVTSRATWISALPESLKHEFSLKELQQMQQQFCDFDETGDGSIAASELVVLMKSMGIYATLDDVQVLIDKVDDNHSGELEFHEFVRLVSEFRRGDGDKLSEFIQYSKLVLEIRHELHDLTENPTQYSTPCPVKENAWEWRVAVQGPASTPYERGTFLFHVRFGHDYPYEAPMLTCLTRIYHPNFVPLLNGSMAVYGFMERWDPEWRMRGLLERLEQLLNCPDVDLMTAFQNETTARLARVEVSAGAKRMRHPREIALDCIDLFISDADIFFSTAQQFTMKIAAETLEEQQPKVYPSQ